MKIAIEEMNQEDLKKLEEYLDGSNVYLFTDLNPFKLALLLERGKVKNNRQIRRHSRQSTWLFQQATQVNLQVQSSAN